MSGVPNLTVQQLEYLDAVAEAPTWAVAAERLGVTPSALSQGLAELERRVGVPLFERQGRRRVFSAGAGPVLDHARAVLAGTRDLAAWATRVRAGDSGVLRVGVIDAAAVHHYPQVLRRVRQERPDVQLRLSVAPSAPLLGDLARGELDMAVCVEPPTGVEGVAWSVLRVDPLAVLAAPDAAPGPPRTWGPWVTFPAGSHTRAVIVAALRSAGAPIEVVAESHQPEVLREMVRLGLGWTVLPVVQAGDLHVVRRLGERRLVVARRHGAAPNPAADALTSVLRAARPPRVILR